MPLSFSCGLFEETGSSSKTHSVVSTDRSSSCEGLGALKRQATGVAVEMFGRFCDVVSKLPSNISGCRITVIHYTRMSSSSFRIVVAVITVNNEQF